MSGFKTLAVTLRSVSLVPGVIYEWTPDGDQSVVPVLDVDLAPPLARSVALEPGAEVVPGYRLVKQIGEGCTGEVWRATGPGGVAVALKFIGAHQHGATQELRSLGLMLEVRHANLVSIFGIWQRSDWTVIGMDLADGTLLDRFEFARSRGEMGLDPGELTDLFRQVARGIDYLNEPIHALPNGGSGQSRMALLHRDIKPQNLLMVGGSVKLGDFGLVERWDGDLDPSNCPISDAIDSLVTAYTAPEVRRGRLSARSDQYSLAATYCHLRGGRAPSPPMRVESIAADSPGSSPEIDLAMLPDHEQAVVARALALDPRSRWPSCSAFVEALIASSEGLGLDRKPVAFARLVAGGTRAAPARKRPSRVVPGLAVLAVVAAVVLVSVGLGHRQPARNDKTNLSTPPVAMPEEISTGSVLESRFLASLETANPSLVEPVPPPRVDEVVEEPAPEPSVTEVPEEPAPGLSVAAVPQESPSGPSVAEVLTASRVWFEGKRAVIDPGLATFRTWLASLPRPEPVPVNIQAKTATPALPTAVDLSDQPPVPRTTTIIVRLPSSKAELVVRGPVGRGNPDEWYGPRRVIHSPPLTGPQDYLIGAFWTDPDGQPLTRSQPVRVAPGRLYEVDLRASVPTAVEVPRSPSL